MYCKSSIVSSLHMPINTLNPSFILPITFSSTVTDDDVTL